jgi:hypothetical protein
MQMSDEFGRGGPGMCRSRVLMHWVWLWFVGLTTAAALMHSAQAVEPARTLAQYHHRVFTPRDNTPTQINELAQTEDGYLWGGTATGRYRFDGVNFELMSALDGHKGVSGPSPPGGGLPLEATLREPLPFDYLVADVPMRFVGRGEVASCFLKTGRAT